MPKYINKKTQNLNQKSLRFFCEIAKFKWNTYSPILSIIERTRYSENLACKEETNMSGEN
jgi:hypothetical protein